MVGISYLIIVLAITTWGPQQIQSEHSVVFKKDGHFAGWPANNGIWNWGNEIVVGFTLGYHKDNPNGHTIDGNQPQVPRFARSLDGGRTWKIEIPSYLNKEGKEATPKPCEESIDFKHPDFAMQFRMVGSNHGYSHFYWSNDRCKTWHGPFQLPTFDRKGIFARTDYEILGKHEMIAYLTAAKEDGNEGWPFSAHTHDGGKTWKHLSWIGNQPGKGGYSIMPSTIRLSPEELLTFIRRRSDSEQAARTWWIEPYRSTDNGKTWHLETENLIDNAGNPAHMLKLPDGRLVVTYGYRRSPFGIRARISTDQGKTWSQDIILRKDGGNWDLGYPRTVLRSDGRLVTVYYFNNPSSEYRYIAATIWTPPSSP